MKTRILCKDMPSCEYSILEVIDKFSSIFGDEFYFEDGFYYVKRKGFEEYNLLIFYQLLNNYCLMLEDKETQLAFGLSDDTTERYISTIDTNIRYIELRYCCINVLEWCSVVEFAKKACLDLCNIGLCARAYDSHDPIYGYSIALELFCTHGNKEDRKVINQRISLESYFKSIVLWRDSYFKCREPEEVLNFEF